MERYLTISSGKDYTPLGPRPCQRHIGHAVQARSGECSCPRALDLGGQHYSEAGINHGSKAPALSVIIPTIGRPYELRRTLGQLHEFSRVFRLDLEILVVVDGTIIEPVPVSDLMGLRYHFETRRVGAAAARNIGVAKSCGTYVAFLDDDVIITSDWMVAVIQAMQADVRCITGPILCSGRTVLSRSRSLRYRARYQHITCFSPVPFLAGGNTLMRRDVFERYRGFAPLRQSSDNVFAHWLYGTPDACRFCHSMTVWHRNDRGWRAALLSAWRGGGTAALYRFEFDWPAFHVKGEDYDVLAGIVGFVLWGLKMASRIYYFVLLRTRVWLRLRAVTERHRTS